MPTPIASPLPMWLAFALLVASRFCAAKSRCGQFYNVTDAAPTVIEYGPYDVGEFCIWLGEAPERERLNVDIDSVQLEQLGAKCMDILEIRESSAFGKLLYRGCSGSSVHLESATRWAWVMFHSDHEQNANGFTLRLTTVDNSAAEVIDAPPYYDCVWPDFLCANRQCISNASVCNCVNNCGDNSDEANCDQRACQPGSRQKSSESWDNLKTIPIAVVSTLCALLLIATVIAGVVMWRRRRRLQKEQEMEQKRIAMTTEPQLSIMFAPKARWPTITSTRSGLSGISGMYRPDIPTFTSAC